MRVRISTTVDATRLEEARRRTGRRDSDLLDAALVALLDTLDFEAEMRAIGVAPYEDDPDLRMPPAAMTDDEYVGEVPAEVLQLAKQRRAARRRA